MFKIQETIELEQANTNFKFVGSNTKITLGHSIYAGDKCRRSRGGIQLLRPHLGEWEKGGGGPSKCEHMRTGGGGCHINANVRI